VWKRWRAGGRPASESPPHANRRIGETRNLTSPSEVTIAAYLSWASWWMLRRDSYPHAAPRCIRGLGASGSRDKRYDCPVIASVITRRATEAAIGGRRAGKRRPGPRPAAEAATVITTVVVTSCYYVHCDICSTTTSDLRHSYYSCR